MNRSQKKQRKSNQNRNSESEKYLTDIAVRHVRGGCRERNSLMLAGELVGSVDLLVARPAQRRLVRAAEHVRLRRLAHVALYLHLPLSLSTISISPEKISNFSL